MPAASFGQAAQSEPTLQDVRELLENGRFAAADAILTNMLSSAEFDSEDSYWLSSVYAMSAEVAIEIGDEGRASDMIRLLAAEPDADIFRLYGLVGVARRKGSADIAADMLQVFVSTSPEALSAFSVDEVAGIIGSLGESSLESELWVSLVDAMEAANTASVNLEFVSNVWERVAVAALERRETELALEAVSRIRTVLPLIAIQVDRRFAALVAARPELFDIGAATQREVDAYVRQATANPRMLAPRVELARSLRRANRLGEALAVANLTIDRLLLPNGDARNWDDVASSTGNLLGQKAVILRDLGRPEEAIAQLTQARLMPELDGPNLNQAFDLAQYYAQAGMLEEAAVLADGLRDQSPDAARVMGFVDLMIAVQQADVSAIDAALSDLADARQEARELDVLALVMAGRLDAAAVSYIVWLNSSESRLGALLFLQEFIFGAAGVPPTPFERLYLERKAGLREREDVQAAVTAVGRFDSFNIRYE